MINVYAESGNIILKDGDTITIFSKGKFSVVDPMGIMWGTAQAFRIVSDIYIFFTIDVSSNW